MDRLVSIALLLAAVNIATFAAFGLDKRRAQRRQWRLPEKTLLSLAALGGTPGAYLGRRHFRHKTRKTGFTVALHLIAAAQLAFALWLLARS